MTTPTLLTQCGVKYTDLQRRVGKQLSVAVIVALRHSPVMRNSREASSLVKTYSHQLICNCKKNRSSLVESIETYDRNILNEIQIAFSRACVEMERFRTDDESLPGEQELWFQPLHEMIASRRKMIR